MLEKIQGRLGLCRWLLYPPDRVPPGVKVTRSEDGSLDVQAPNPVQWLLEVECRNLSFTPIPHPACLAKTPLCCSESRFKPAIKSGSHCFQQEVTLQVFLSLLYGGNDVVSEMRHLSSFLQHNAAPFRAVSENNAEYHVAGDRSIRLS